MLSRLRKFIARAIRDRRGNVLMIFGLTLIPLTFATGMGIDYARAMRLQTKLDAAADASALAAVSKLAMGGPYTAAQVQAYAVQLFMTQTQNLVGAGGLTINYYDTSQLNVVLSDTTANTVTKRTATVTYRAQSANAFGSILGLASLTIKGTSQTAASTAPNIDFYVMIDTSPSMLLPATSAGLATMVANTQSQCDGNGHCGCAFACHVTGSTNDNYAIARNQGLSLRTDLVSSAVGDLTTTATKLASTNGANYRMGLMDFDYMQRQIWPTSKNGNYWVDNDLTRVKSHVGDAVVLSYCANNYRVCNTLDNDTATNFTTAMGGANTQMTTPGKGTNQSGDTPQAILFIITDGMRDEATNGRVMGPIPTALCDTIKNRNIRIAILNTQYLPASASDQWSMDNVKTPFLSPADNITPALTACASPGLFYQVTTDDDVSAALGQLFQQAVATAHIIQ